MIEDAYIVQSTFEDRLLLNYPKLYDHMFANVQHGSKAGVVVAFIKEHNIELTEGKNYVSYDDVWNYIKQNEHLHEWWML